MTTITTSGRGGRGRNWQIAAMLSIAALGCGLLLGGLSAWFLGSVAIAGLTTATALTFNFHIPGALVRLLAIGRTTARYGERLVGHRAALDDQVERRVELFGAMAAAPQVRAVGWQLGDASRLADYLDDVEDIDFARLRAGLPALTSLIALGGLMIATAVWAPLALLPIAAALALVGLSASWLAREGAGIWQRRRAAQRDAAQRFGAAMGSIVPLLAERAWAAMSGSALDAFSETDRMTHALAKRQSLVDALGSALAPVGLVSVIASAWYAGARGSDLLVPTFIGFAWLALSETLQGASRMLMAELRRRAAVEGLAQWTAPSPADSCESGPSPLRIAALVHTGLVRRSPAGRPLGAALPIRLKRGRPTVLAGASGAGKTSLIKQIAGWLGDDTMSAEGEQLSPQLRRRLAVYCPHDAAILSDTIRANLFAPHASDAEIQAALDAVELSERVAAAGGLNAWVTQDMMSMGEAQRLNLARTWLSQKPIVLLDEPGEHLDDAQAARIVARFGVRFSDRILVLSSHKPIALPNANTIIL